MGEPVHIKEIIPGILKEAARKQDERGKISDTKMKCSECGWVGTIHDCEVDEEDGEPVCPKCGGRCGIWWD